MTVRSVYASMIAAGLLVSTWAVAQQQTGTCGGPEAKASACGGKTAKAVSDTPAACDKEKGACCQAKGSTVAACDGEGAALAKAVRAGMPKMMYRVGDKSMCCPEEATKAAQAEHATVQYVVGEQSFEKEGDAKQAYAKALDGFLSEITAVKYVVGDSCVACPDAAASLAKSQKKSVKYRVASYDFADAEAANKAVAQAKQAAEKVEMKMAVGDATYSCPMEAASAAKTAHKSVEYCVGEKRTACKVTASVDLALAKVDAAIHALAQAAQG